jgi:hypothetical protein
MLLKQYYYSGINHRLLFLVDLQGRDQRNEPLPRRLRFLARHDRHDDRKQKSSRIARCLQSEGFSYCRGCITQGPSR